MNRFSKWIYKVRMRNAAPDESGMINLLAWDGTAPNRRFGWLGNIVHGTTKTMTRAALSQIHKKAEPALFYKQQSGWKTDHVAAMSEGWNWVMSMDERPMNRTIGGFKGPDDKNRIMLKHAGDMAWLWLDEDTHYGIRVMLWLKWVHEHWDRFEQSAEQAYQIMNFDRLYKDILEYTSPLPQDDGTDPVGIDYIQMEKKLRDKNGMDNTGKRKG